MLKLKVHGNKSIKIKIKLTIKKEYLQGDPAKAKKNLNWTCKITFEVYRIKLKDKKNINYYQLIVNIKELVKEMVKSDIELMKNNPIA